MPTGSPTRPLLRFIRDSIRTIECDDIGQAWYAISRCRGYIEDGDRIENNCWRAWYCAQARRTAKTLGGELTRSSQQREPPFSSRSSVSEVTVGEFMLRMWNKPSAIGRGGPLPPAPPGILREATRRDEHPKTARFSEEAVFQSEVSASFRKSTRVPRKRRKLDPYSDIPPSVLPPRPSASAPTHTTMSSTPAVLGGSSETPSGFPLLFPLSTSNTDEVPDLTWSTRSSTTNDLSHSSANSAPIGTQISPSLARSSAIPFILPTPTNDIPGLTWSTRFSTTTGDTPGSYSSALIDTPMSSSLAALDGSSATPSMSPLHLQLILPSLDSFSRSQNIDVPSQVEHKIGDGGRQKQGGVTAMESSEESQM